MKNNFPHNQNKGNLEKVSSSYGFININGWASSRGSGLPIGFHIKIGEIDFTDFEFELNLQSPDVNSRACKI